MSSLLDGIRILDLSRLLPGPLCTMHLCDQGAEVIKIEDPKRGDYARTDMAFTTSMSHLFHALNRGKKSVILDLRSDQGRKQFLQLVETADIVVESFRPGVLRSWGLGPDTLRAQKPSLIICSLTAYGQTGPRRDHPAHDNNMCGYAGIADQFPRVDGAAVPPNFQIADIAGGALTAANAISMALVRKARTGEGATIDISLTEGALSAAVIPFAMAQLHGKAPAPGQDVLTGLLPCYRYYRTKDDRQVAVGALEPKFWGTFCNAINRPDLIPLGLAIGEAADGAVEKIAALFASKTHTEWSRILSNVDACVTPTLTLEEALASPLMKERGMVFDAEDPVDGPLQRLAAPIIVDGERARPSTPAPRHGQHTEQFVQDLE